MPRKLTQNRFIQRIEGLERENAEIKRHLADLQESEANFRIIAEKSNDLIVIVQNGITVYRNPSYEKLIGYSVNETKENGFDITYLQEY